MERFINESFASTAQAIACVTCERKVHYHDRLDDNSLVCLSCSYDAGYKQAEECVMHGKEFDPHDDDLRVEMIRIAKIDIDRSDKTVCTVSAVIPEDLWGPVGKLIKLNGSSLNAEIVSALGWYTTLCLTRRSSAPLDYSNLQSVRAESSELAEILGPDNAGVDTP